MEAMVNFRDYQEVVTADLNNPQLFAQQSLDDIVHDAVTASLRFAGFNTAKSNTAEITVQPGRFYGANLNSEVGAVFTLPTASIISLVQYLAVSSQRILTLTAYGVVNSTDVQTRKYITNTSTLATSPESVAMKTSRDAVLAIVAGAESGTPTPPAIQSNQIAICDILISNTQVISVTMRTAGQVTSTEDLDERTGLLETFEAQAGPRISALATDLAALALKIGGTANQDLLIEVMQDLSKVKVLVGLPATYSQYGSDYYLWPNSTAYDTANAQSLGFACTITYGIRFPAQNANTFALTLFSSIDPNAQINTYNASGLLLPAYASVLKLQTGTFASSVAIGQYTFQTFGYQELDIPYTRIQYGGTYWSCTNSGTVYSPSATSNQPWWLPNFASYNVDSDVNTVQNVPGHVVTTGDYLQVDTWTEPYWTLDATTNTVNGALIAQSWLVSSDTWYTGLDIYISGIASATDVTIIVCQCTNGQPDLTKTLAKGVIPGASLVIGFNGLTFATPILGTKGDRLAAVITSAANHQIGLAAAGSYLDGTFFYSLDGAYFLGDFSKELVLLVFGAEFATAQTTIEFAALSLSGGIRAIDLTARMQVPASCELTFECLPDGTATWLPVKLDPSDSSPPFPTAPVLVRFRARFVGTQDVMPGIVLPDSIMKIWCPATAFTFVSAIETLAVPSSTITVKLLVENYNPTPHTVAVKLFYGGVQHVAAATTVVLADASRGGYNVTATFNAPTMAAGGAISTAANTITMSGSNPGTVGPGMTVLDTTLSPAKVIGIVSSWTSGTTLHLTANAAFNGSGSTDTLVFQTSSFTLEIFGTTNSAANVFLVSSSTWYAL